MFSITRQQVRQLRSLFRRMATRTDKSQPTHFQCEAGPEGLRIYCRTARVALAWQQDGVYPPFRCTLPFSFLGDCEGADRSPVTFQRSDERTFVDWHAGAIPQQRWFEMKDHPALEPLPDLPRLMSMGAAPVFPTLAEAARSTADSEMRYLMSHLQLRGPTAEVAATDGAQLVILGGVPWPWEGNLIVPCPRLFSSKELDQPSVLVGSTDDHVVFASAPWTVWLTIPKEGKFPPVDEILPKLGTADGRLQLDAGDAAFLAQSLPQLPQRGEEPHITLHVNGQVVVRARGLEGPATELLLVNSQPEGKELLLNLHRQPLERCLELGCRDFRLWKDRPLVALAPDRRFIFQPLQAPEPLASDPQARRIESPRSSVNRSRPQPERSVMPTVTQPVAEKAPARVSAPKTSVPVAPPAEVREAPLNLVQEAEMLRSQVRDLVGGVNRLLTGLKQQRRRSRQMRSTLQTLRELKFAA